VTISEQAVEMTISCSAVMTKVSKEETDNSTVTGSGIGVNKGKI